MKKPPTEKRSDREPRAQLVPRNVAERPEPTITSITSGSENSYIVSDSRHLNAILETVPQIDVTVTSPPYWDAKNYGTQDQVGHRQTLAAYLDDLSMIFAQIWHRTKSTGSLWIVVKPIKKNGTLHLLPFLLAEKLTTHPEAAWHLQDIVIWHKTHTLPWSRRDKLTDSHEYVLCLSKTRDFNLSVDSIRDSSGITNWWVKYPERYHPKGKSVNNVWEIPIPTQGAWGNGHFSHFCPLPVELVERILAMTTKRGGTVLDPFAGTGTTALAAAKMGRNWLAVDVNPEFREMFFQRLANEHTQKKPLSRRGERDLVATNLALRQLKLAVGVYKRLAPRLGLTAKDIPLIILLRGKLQASPRPFWVRHATLVLTLSDECFDKDAGDIVSEATSLLSRPPLSKFQIELQIVVCRQSEVQIPWKNSEIQISNPRSRFHVYLKGEFWRASSTLTARSLSSLQLSGAIPPIAANINVAETPAY